MSTFYLDYENGNDSTTATPLGWWSVPFTGGTAPDPVVSGLVTGAVSGATARMTAVVLSGGAWATSDAAGTMYFYGKSATAFQAEQVDFDSGGHMDIAADFTYCAWKTITTGATAARIAPGDVIRIAKSPDPTSLGQSALWTGTTRRGGAFDAAVAVSAMADNGSGAIRLTTAAQTWANSGIIQVLGLVTTGNTYEANGNWIGEVIDTTHVDLIGSTYVNTRASGGTAQNITSKCVILTSGITVPLENCEDAWTIGAQTTSAARDATVFKEGGASVKIITAATCNPNQILAQHATSATLDLSGYQQVSFWIRNETTALTASGLQLRLYDDAACTSLQETFNIPAIASTARWVPITIDKGSAMYSGIAGVALYTTVQLNSKTIYIDNIMACKASSAPDSLTLQSLISKNTTVQSSTSDVGYANEGWYAIQSISGQGSINAGRIILLDNETNTLSSAGKGYSGTTELAPTYKRETIKTASAASTSTNVQEIQEAGADGNNTQYQGGFSINTNTQNGETFFDGLNGYGYGLYINNKSYNTVNYLSFTRYRRGLTTNSNNYLTIENLTNANNCDVGLRLNGDYGIFTTILNLNNNGSSGLELSTSKFNIISLIVNCNNNLSYGYNLSSSAVLNTHTNIVNMNNNAEAIDIPNNGNYSNLFTSITNINYNSSYGLNISSYNNSFDTITNITYNGNYGIYFYGGISTKFGTLSNVSNNTTYGIVFGDRTTNCIIKSFTSSNNTSAAIGVYVGPNYIYKAIIDESTKVSVGWPLNNACLYINNLDGYATIYTDYGLITSQATTRHTESGVAWKMSPTNLLRNSSYPLVLSIAKIACASGGQVTVTAYMKLSNTTDVLGALVVQGGQLNGVSYQKVDMSTIDIAWHPVTLNFTPSEAGVVEVEAWAWWVAGTADESIYIDDVTITQA